MAEEEGDGTPPASPKDAVDMAVAARQEDDLETLENVVQSYMDGINTPETKLGRENLAKGCEMLRALWLELEEQVGFFHANHFPTLQLCRAAAKLFSKPDDDLAPELLQIGGQSTFGPLLRICGRPEDTGSADRNSEVRHYASSLIYRLLPSKIGIAWITDNLNQVDVISALFGDEEEAGSVREHAAAVLLSLARVNDLRDQLSQPAAVVSYVSTLAYDTQADEYSNTLRRYAGTILADLSSAPALHHHVLQDPASTLPVVINLLKDSTAADARSSKRTAASILSNLSQEPALQPPILQCNALEPLIAACGENVLEPEDPKLQLLALFTLANISSNEMLHGLLCGEEQLGPPEATGSSRPGTAVSFEGSLTQSPPGTASMAPIFQVVLPLMREDVRPQSQRQRYAFAILTRLARSPSNQDRIGSHATVFRRILVVMTRAEEEAAAARQAASLLSVLSVTAHNQMRIAKARLPINMTSDEVDDENKRSACYLLVKALKTVDSALSRCAACAITNVAANVDAHPELFACNDLVSVLFGLIRRNDPTLQQYACDALSNLALGSHRRPPTRDEDVAARAASDIVPEHNEYKVEFTDAGQCLAMCRLIPLEEEEQEENQSTTSSDSDALQEHAVNALCSLGRCRANQIIMKKEPTLLRRLARFLALMLDKFAAAQSAEEDPDLPIIKVDEQPLIFALRLIGALCPTELPGGQEFEPELARCLIRVVQVGPMRTVTVSLNALRKMCKNSSIHKLCAESEQLLADISRHLDSGIRHVMKEKMNRPIRRAAAELLFKLTCLQESVELIARTCSQDYLMKDRPLGDVMGACLKVCDVTPDDAPDLKAAACGAMFNAVSHNNTAARLADDPVLVSFAIPRIGVNLDRTADDFLPRQRLQEYIVGLLSNLATLPVNRPQLVRHMATVLPNGLQDVTSALHEQLCNAAACLTETADERWEFTQTTEKRRSGCYAAALLSKLTELPEVRKAAVIQKRSADTALIEKAMIDVQQGLVNSESSEQAPEADIQVVTANDDDVLDADDIRTTYSKHRALDRAWWKDTLLYECPIADKMFRLLDDDNAMTDPSDLGLYAAITLWHLTSSPENEQRIRRTIGVNTSGWISIANRLAKVASAEMRKRPDTRGYLIATTWNLIRVHEFQPKVRHTDNFMRAVVDLCIGIRKEDPVHCYSTKESMVRLRSSLAGLLTEMVRDTANAQLLAANTELHLTLISWIGVEKFEQEKEQILAAKQSARSSKQWSTLRERALSAASSKSESLSLHAVVEQKANDFIEFSHRAAFAERTVHVKHVAKKWLDEKTLCQRLSAYGAVAGGIVRTRGPGDHGYIPEGEQGFHQHQSWAMVSFIEKAAVQRMFQNPHDPNQFKESIDVKADPDELRHIDDPDVVFSITHIDPEKAMASTGQFGEKFEELRDRVQHMTTLAKRAHYVLHVLMHLKDVKERLSEKYVQTETDAIAAKRRQECVRLLDATHGNAM